MVAWRASRRGPVTLGASVAPVNPWWFAATGGSGLALDCTDVRVNSIAAARGRAGSRVPSRLAGKTMQEIPTFNPRALYPILGIAMPRTRIEDDTGMPDLLVPCGDGKHAGQPWVERKFLLDLLESPSHWANDVAHHVGVADGGGRLAASPVEMHYITFNPAARLRIVTTQTFAWARDRKATHVTAVDDARAQVLAIEARVDPGAHPWRSASAVAGEHAVRLCDRVGFDLSPSGRKQYWPGRELAPIIDYLPHRFVVKLAYARYAIARLLAAAGRGAG